MFSQVLRYLRLFLVLLVAEFAKISETLGLFTLLFEIAQTLREMLLSLNELLPLEDDLALLPDPVCCEISLLVHIPRYELIKGLVVDGDSEVNFSVDFI